MCSSLVDSLYYRLLNRRVSAFKTMKYEGDLFLVQLTVKNVLKSS
ncbi:hypothetical protein I33_1511 [Bacillus subtilis subsp. subtilis str. RO-NN-1]|nr:hypothetical protein I33_1511 [Bacillus subtilis subsp. subtilis str. RO-NN-1]